MKTILSIVLVLSLTACGGQITQSDITGAVKLCSTNEGLSHIDSEYGTTFVEVRCNNKAMFNLKRS